MEEQGSRLPQGSKEQDLFPQEETEISRGAVVEARARLQVQRGSRECGARISACLLRVTLWPSAENLEHTPHLVDGSGLHGSVERRWT